MKKIILSLITLTIVNFGAIAQNVTIPDANLKGYLVSTPSINTNSDSEIQLSEANTFSGSMDCSSLNISDMTGLEEFIVLTQLTCNFNNLNSLDVTQNIDLTYLSCYNNNIGTLDLSQNIDLDYLNCFSNNLSAIDVSQNVALTFLQVSGNNISVLDVTQNLALINLHLHTNNISVLDVSLNTSLTVLFCSGNNLSTLDVSNNTSLFQFGCQSNSTLSVLNMKNINPSALTSFYATSNPSLTCIEVDDVATATTAWTNIDPGVLYSVNCVIDLVTSITVQGQGGQSTISTQGGTLQMEASVLPTYADDDTYTWSVANGTGSASISASGLLTAITNGTLTVIATANDASGVTGTEVITISNQDLGVNEQAIYNVSIYPNPATSQLNIDSEQKIETIVIMNVMGKAVKTIVTPNNTIDVSELTKGIYFLQIQTNKGLVSKKFIKK